MPSHQVRRGAASAVALLLAAGSVLAHPSVVGSTPKNGAALVDAPRQMRIAFSEPIEPAFTSVKLVDAHGKDVGGEQTRPDPDDAKAIVVALPRLAAGAYKVHWSALGRDGHRVKGQLSFSVK